MPYTLSLILFAALAYPLNIQLRAADDPVFCAQNLQQTRLYEDCPLLEVGRHEYRVESLLGRGGHAWVYELKSTDQDQNQRALKLAKVLYKKELEHEFNILVKLAQKLPDERFFPKVFGLEETDFGVGLVMESLKGYSRLLDYKFKSEKEVFEIFINLASSLEKLHESGFIHHDIKPKNVLISKNKEIKIIDFGLAIAEKDLAQFKEKMKKERSIHGSVQYISPEYASGIDVSAQDDVWSLSVCLYEALLGRPLFPIVGYNPQKPESFDSIQVQREVVGVLKGTTKIPLPDLLSQRAKAVFSKAFQKSSLDRYQSMREFRMALENENLEVEQESGSTLKSKSKSKSAPFSGFLKFLGF